MAQTPPSDRLVVSSAVLELLRHSARANPVLVVVDDLPWLDPVSANALGFVARRAAGTHSPSASAATLAAGHVLDLLTAGDQPPRQVTAQAAGVLHRPPSILEPGRPAHQLSVPGQRGVDLHRRDDPMGARLEYQE